MRLEGRNHQPEKYRSVSWSVRRVDQELDRAPFGVSPSLFRNRGPGKDSSLANSSILVSEKSLQSIGLP